MKPVRLFPIPILLDIQPSEKKCYNAECTEIAYKLNIAQVKNVWKTNIYANAPLNTNFSVHFKNMKKKKIRIELHKCKSGVQCMSKLCE